MYIYKNRSKYQNIDSPNTELKNINMESIKETSYTLSDFQVIIYLLGAQIIFTNECNVPSHMFVRKPPSTTSTQLFQLNFTLHPR